MKVLICGDRNWTDSESIFRELIKFPKDTTVIEGEARGADTLGRIEAEKLGFEVLKFPAKWKEYGRAAGSIRNRQMLDEGRPDRVLAFHHDIGASKGTANMVRQARDRGIPVSIFTE